MFPKFPQVSLMSIAAFVSVVGGVSANQFVVYLPSVEPSLVPQVRAIAPDAFFSQLDSGQRVLQVGRFNNLAIAQRRVQEFRQAGFNAEIRSVVPRTAPPVAAPIPIATFPPTALPPLPGVPASPTPIEISRPAPIPQPISNLPPVSTIPQAPVPHTPVASQIPPISENRFFVIIPTNSAVILERVRAIVPQARLRVSSRGPYIEVQGYPDRASAEIKSASIRGQGFDARVAFF